MRPDITFKVRRFQERRKASHNHCTKHRSIIVIGNAGFLKNFGDGPVWLDTLRSLFLQVNGRLHMDSGPTTYEPDDEDGKLGRKWILLGS
jgi:hypothetical protein